VARSSGRLSYFVAVEALWDAEMLKPINKLGRTPMQSYSQAMLVTASQTLYVSGQVAIGCEKSDGIQQQTRVAIDNLNMVLVAAEMTMENIAKLCVYLVDEQDLDEFMAEAKPLLPSPPPALTLVVVKSLAESSYLVEIEAVAVK
jgi:2-iminobutanoate/2-iminopropanoate deaminase